MCTNRVGDDVVCVQIGLVTMWFVYKYTVVGDDVVCVQIGLVTMWFVYK